MNNNAGPTGQYPANSDDPRPHELTEPTEGNIRDSAEFEKNHSRKTMLPLPGMVAIGLYMLVLAAAVAFGVVSRHLPRFLLILVPLFAIASFGLLRMFRWAWALTLSAVFLLMTYNVWIFFNQQQTPAAIQGLLNLVFFLYLVRMDVRRRLR